MACRNGGWGRTRVPDAVQRSPGDANGSRECAPDDRLRIVRSHCSAEPGPMIELKSQYVPRLSSAPLTRCVLGTKGNIAPYPFTPGRSETLVGWPLAPATRT